jgi:hypothetical protein
VGWNHEEKVRKPSKDGGWSAWRRRRKEWLVMTRRNAGQDAQARPKSSRVGSRMKISARMSSLKGSASPAAASDAIGSRGR